MEVSLGGDEVKSVEAVFSEAREVERKLKALYKERDKKGTPPDVYARNQELIDQLRPELLDKYRFILRADRDFTAQHEVEQLLWKSCFYKAIEDQRRRWRVLNQSASIPRSNSAIQRHKVSYQQYLQQVKNFYENLLSDQLAVAQIKRVRSSTFHECYEPPVGSPTDEEKDKRRIMMNALLSCHRSLIFLGDLERYIQATQTRPHWNKADRYYMRALDLLPGIGNPHNQLAVVATHRNDSLGAMYRYIRALSSADEPFPTSWRNLKTVFDQNHELFRKLVGGQPEAEWGSLITDLPSLTCFFVKLFAVLYRGDDVDQFPTLHHTLLKKLDMLVFRTRTDIRVPPVALSLILLVTCLFCVHKWLPEAQVTVLKAELERRRQAQGGGASTTSGSSGKKRYRKKKSVDDINTAPDAAADVSMAPTAVSSTSTGASAPSPLPTPIKTGGISERHVDRVALDVDSTAPKLRTRLAVYSLTFLFDLVGLLARTVPNKHLDLLGVVAVWCDWLNEHQFALYPIGKLLASQSGNGLPKKLITAEVVARAQAWSGLAALINKLSIVDELCRRPPKSGPPIWLAEEADLRGFKYMARCYRDRRDFARRRQPDYCHRKSKGGSGSGRGSHQNRDKLTRWQQARRYFKLCEFAQNVAIPEKLLILDAARGMYCAGPSVDGLSMCANGGASTGAMHPGPGSGRGKKGGKPKGRATRKQSSSGTHNVQGTGSGGNLALGVRNGTDPTAAAAASNANGGRRGRGRQGKPSGRGGQAGSRGGHRKKARQRNGKDQGYSRLQAQYHHQQNQQMQQEMDLQARQLLQQRQQQHAMASGQEFPPPLRTADSGRASGRGQFLPPQKSAYASHVGMNEDEVITFQQGPSSALGFEEYHAPNMNVNPYAHMASAAAVDPANVAQSAFMGNATHNVNPYSTNAGNSVGLDYSAQLGGPTSASSGLWGAPAPAQHQHHQHPQAQAQHNDYGTEDANGANSFAPISPPQQRGWQPFGPSLFSFGIGGDSAPSSGSQANVPEQASSARGATSTANTWANYDIRATGGPELDQLYAPHVPTGTNEAQGRDAAVGNKNASDNAWQTTSGGSTAYPFTVGGDTWSPWASLDNDQHGQGDLSKGPVNTTVSNGTDPAALGGHDFNFNELTGAFTMPPLPQSNQQQQQQQQQQQELQQQQNVQQNVQPQFNGAWQSYDNRGLSSTGLDAAHPYNVNDLSSDFSRSAAVAYARQAFSSSSVLSATDPAPVE